MLSTIKIFISSPGDVAEERQVAGKVIAQLQGKYWSFVRLDDVFWETGTVRATAHYQDEIVHPGDCEIVVGILWSRLGSPLPKKFNSLAGLPRTGTEWELEEAFAAHDRSASGRPDIVVYRREAKRPRLEGSDDEAEAAGQEAALEAYLRREYFFPDGTIRRPVRGFGSPGEFEALFRKNLETLILRLIPGLKAGDDPPPISGCPFKELRAFDFHDRDRFFGRNRQIREVQDLLRERKKGGAGRPGFVLIYGASGYGKSSLMRAGVAPAVARAGGVDDGAGTWRRVLFQPSRGHGALLERFARELLAAPSAEDLEASETHAGFPLPGLEELGGEPLPEAVAGSEGQEGSWDLASLARVLSDHEDFIFAVSSVQGWLERAGTHLLIQIDQLEEVFRETFAAAEREAFFRALHALCRCPNVWGLGTMRSDAFPEVARHRWLKALVGADGGYILPPPDAQMLSEVIRFPALAARLEFERRTGPVAIGGEAASAEFLNDQIFEDARGSPDALPLLEFCLTRLYEDTLPVPAVGGAEGGARDLGAVREGDLLRWGRYAELGGLKGAIASAADEVLSGLRPTVWTDAAEAQLFGALVRVDPSRGEASRRRADCDGLRAGPAAPALDAFLGARLLVTDRDGSTGRTVVFLAHDSLLTHWERLAGWVDGHRDDLAAHQRLIEQAEQWVGAGRSRGLLLSDARLAAAERVCACGDFRLTPDQEDFVRESKNRAKRRLRFFQAAAAVFLLLATAACMLWFRAEAAQFKTEEANNDLTRTLAASYYDRGLESLNGRNAWSAAPYFAKALRLEPENRTYRRMAYSYITQEPFMFPRLLTSSAGQWEWRHQPGSHLLYGLPEGEAPTVFDLRDGSVKRGPRTFGFGHFAVSGSGRYAVSDQSGIRVFDAFPDPDATPSIDFRWTLPFLVGFAGRDEAETLIAVVGKQAGDTISATGQSKLPPPIALGAGGDLRPMDGELDSYATMLSTSPADPLALVTSKNGNLSLWDAQALQVVENWEVTGYVRHAEFSPDGRRFAFCGTDNYLRVWKSDPPEELWSQKFRDDATTLAWNQAGELIAVAVDRDQGGTWLSVWDSATGIRTTGSMTESEKVESLAFSADSERLYSIGRNGGFSGWDVPSARLLWVARHGGEGKRIFAAPETGGSPVEPVATITAQGEVGLWHPEARRTGATLQFGGDVVRVVCSPKAANILLTVSEDERGKDVFHQVFSLSTLEPLHPPVHHGGGSGEIDDAVLTADSVLLKFKDGLIERWSIVGERTGDVGLRAGSMVTDSDSSETEFGIGGWFNTISPSGKWLATFTMRAPIDFQETGGWSELSEQMVKIVESNALSTTTRVFSTDSFEEIAFIEKRGAILFPIDFDGENGWLVGFDAGSGELRRVDQGDDGEWHVEGDGEWHVLGERSTSDIEERGNPSNLEKVPQGAQFSDSVASANGAYFAVYYSDGTVRLYRSGKSEPHATVVAGADIRDVYFSGDGGLVAVEHKEGDAGVLRVYDSGTGMAASPPLTHEDTITRAVFSPDGEFLLAADFGGNAHLWHVRSGRLASMAFLHGDDINDVAFSPDGRFIFTASDDETVGVWANTFGEEPAPPWVPDLMEGVAGRRIGEGGLEVNLETLSADAAATLLGNGGSDLPQEGGGAWSEARRHLLASVESSGGYRGRLPDPVGSGLGESLIGLARDLREAGRPQEAFDALRIARRSLLDSVAPPAEVGDWWPLLDQPESEILAVESRDSHPSRKGGDAIEAGPGIRFRWCPPGRFIMGQVSPVGSPDASRVPRKVVLSRGFWVSETEVTQEQWETVMGTRATDIALDACAGEEEFRIGNTDYTVASYHGIADPEDILKSDGFFGSDKPMIFVSWEDANRFLTEMNSTYPHRENVPDEWVFRLPTEAEWEYACRAGGGPTAHMGAIEILGKNNSPELDEISWYGGTSAFGFEGAGRVTEGYVERSKGGREAGPRRVGMLEPNPWGLYDMLGNVGEWCADTYDKEFGGAEVRSWVIDPFHRGDADTNRCVRGGSWISTVRGCLPEIRTVEEMGWKSVTTGFRIVLGSPLTDG